LLMLKSMDALSLNNAKCHQLLIKLKMNMVNYWLQTIILHITWN